jgi:hypothetical protein
LACSRRIYCLSSYEINSKNSSFVFINGDKKC